MEKDLIRVITNMQYPPAKKDLFQFNPWTSLDNSSLLDNFRQQHRLKYISKHGN